MKISSSWVSLLTIIVITVIVITGLQIFLNINSKVIQVKDVQAIDAKLDMAQLNKMVTNKSLVVHSF